MYHSLGKGSRRLLYIGVTCDKKTKAEVRRAIERRRLTSYMNNTKWRALCTAILEELPFPPAYQEKCVILEKPSPQTLEAVPTYYGDWARTPEAAIGLWTEWIKVAPRVGIHVGQLVPDRIEDCSEPLRNILKKLRVPFKEQDGFFIIYGHTANADDLLSPDE